MRPAPGPLRDEEPAARPPFPLPPEDRALSPRTGWTRAHWEAAADGLLAAVTPYATPGRALYHLPGGRPSFSGHRSDGLEGYARTFLLAAFRIAGAGGADPHGLLGRYADGLAAGTRRPGGDGPEDWPRITDRSQPLVEAASMALALRLTRPWLWDRLDTAVRDRAAAWLADALTAEPWPCNWELFPVTVGGFLAATGHATEAARAARERGLARIETWYAGDGWYTDGPGRAFDYYNGWAMHLYPVLEAHLSADARLLNRHGSRLETHLADYARLFGADGAPLHQGRSLTYRMATTAPLWLGALTGRTPLSPGTTRRLASGTLRHFLDRGRPARRPDCSHSAGTARTRASSSATPAPPPRTGRPRRSSACSSRRTTRCGRTPRSRARPSVRTRSRRCPHRTGCSSPRPPTGSYGCTTTAARTPATTRTTRASPTPPPPARPRPERNPTTTSACSARTARSPRATAWNRWARVRAGRPPGTAWARPGS